jgi:alkylation response protein AidB-like acyl-CoA dehydrogenase
VDFSLNDEQQAAVDLAIQILGDMGAPERMTEVEAGDERFDRDLWAQLATADLLGLCLPEDVGGGGYGFLEACLLSYEQGRSVTPIPWWSGVGGALAIARWGDEAARAEWLPGVGRGERVVTLALAEAGGPDPRQPATAAESVDGGFLLRGAKTVVPFAHVADAIVLAADLDGEAALFVVPTAADGVARLRQDTFNHEPQFHVELDGVRVDATAHLGGADAVAWTVDRATVLLCAVAAGVAERGVRITADYATNRHQFDRPIATFQAVGQRMADGFIDAEAMRLTMLQAATKLADEQPADAEIAVAKFWASQGGSRVGHTGLHVHGGISIDLDYPIHRYFLWSKQLELTLGSGNEHLARLGRHLAATPV